MGTPGPIVSLTLECQRSFITVIDAIKTSDSPSRLLSNWETELGRFRLWANNIGAAKAGRAGLDYRVRDSPYMSQHIVALLSDLREILNDAASAFSNSEIGAILNSREDSESENETSDSSDSDDDPPKPAPYLRRLYEQAVGSVDSLFHVSILIRGVYNNIRTVRAANHIEFVDGEDVLVEFRRIVELKIKWKNQETVDWLVERLADAITLRRRQFYYHKAHREKSSEFPEASEEVQNPRPRQSSRLETTSEANESKAAPHEAAPSRKSKSAMTAKTTGTTATDLAPTEEKKSQIYANLAPSEKRIGENIFPDPPKEPAGKDFECNQCFHVLPAETRKTGLWRYAIGLQG
jgi:hypothetical protein